VAKLDLEDRIAGCLLGGALGDALGAPVEFLSLPEIHNQFGPNGITALAPAYGRVGAITDDTQMTLFTAEGLLRAHNRWPGKGIVSIASCVWHAYLRWLHTQGERSAGVAQFEAGTVSWPDGWLVGVDALHARRAPGNTCLSALRAARPGTLEQPPNGSKGCGAVMRAAPVGLMPLEGRWFQTGEETGVITHGHPSGYLTAGLLAELIGALVSGAPLDASLGRARTELRNRRGAEETVAALDAAEEIAVDGVPTAGRVESLGQGWVAEEALAIAVYCSLAAEDFAHGVTLAVNHGGDSDSTGGITGNILGALLGQQALPTDWLEQLELRTEIEQLAADMVRHHGEYESKGTFDVKIPDFERYPGW
jgi:ADP-ribosylglycohydrolase